jgi:transcriptional regulator with XRE-family HTH domain
MTLRRKHMSSTDSDDSDRSTVVRSADDLARFVRARRTELDLSQDVLAGEADIDRAALSMFERGKRRLSIDAVFRLVQALGMDLEIRRRGR